MDTMTMAEQEHESSDQQLYNRHLDALEAEIERQVDAAIADIRRVPLGTRRRRKPKAQ